MKTTENPPFRVAIIKSSDYIEVYVKVEQFSESEQGYTWVYGDLANKTVSPPNFVERLLGITFESKLKKAFNTCTARCKELTEEKVKFDIELAELHRKVADCKLG